MKKTKKLWYAFYTYSKSEWTVKRNFEQKGIEVFLPIRRESKTWKNGQKSVQEKVLFENYLFAKVYECDADFYSRSRRVLNCVRSYGKPMPVSEETIHTIRCMIKENAELDSNSELCTGKKVRILSGRLKNCVGYLTEQKGKYKFCIDILGINNSMSILVDLREISIQVLSE